MRSTWLSLTFTRFRYLTDFQETNKCDSHFVTASNNIQVKYCRLADRQSIAFTHKLSLLKMTKWHAHVTHMAKHMNTVVGPGPLAPHKSGAAPMVMNLTFGK